MGRSLDEAFAAVSDIIAVLNPELWPVAAVTNSLAAGESALEGRKKDTLNFGVQGAAAGAGGALGQALGQVGGQVGGLAGQTGAKIGSGIGTLAGEAAGATGAQTLLEPVLAKSLGLTQPTTTSATNIAPTSALSKAGTGGGAGPGLGAGGLDVQGGTAPKVFPYSQYGGSGSGPSPASKSIGATPSQGAGYQQQARGI